MIGRHSARRGLEPVAADRQAVGGQAGHDVSQPGTGLVRIDRLAVAGDLV